MVENLKIEGIKDYPIKWICNFECEFCEINPRQYLQITGKKPSNKNIKELEQGLESLNLEIKQKNLVPFDNYEIVDFKED